MAKQKPPYSELVFGHDRLKAEIIYAGFLSGVMMGFVNIVAIAVGYPGASISWAVKVVLPTGFVVMGLIILYWRIRTVA